MRLNELNIPKSQLIGIVEDYIWIVRNKEIFMKKVDGYSYASQPSNSEFMRLIKGQNMDDVLLAIDDMMEELQVVAPKLYYETMERLNNT